MNLTLDNTDSSITYQGMWESPSSHKSSLDYGGNHAFSSDPFANATLTFAGVLHLVGLGQQRSYRLLLSFI